MNLPTLIIRADASLQMGTGHVMRCLALAEPWLAAGSQVILAAQLMPEALGQRALQAGVIPCSISGEAGGIEDAQQMASLAERHPNAWVVVDGYQFGENYLRVLMRSGAKVLLVDDFGGLTHYAADFVLNQNLGATAEWYPQREEKTRLLLGTRYVQLRGEFLRQKPAERAPVQNRTHVLVTLGGSDPDNVTAKVITALQSIPAAEATVVVGGSNPHWEELQASVKKDAAKIRLIRNASNMPELMATSDLAIAAGGTTAWELAYMGVPMMTIVLADNQRSNGIELEAAGVSVNLGWHEEVTPDVLAQQLATLMQDGHKLAAMSASARKLVDGHGSLRVVCALLAHPLDLRPATSEDARLLWEWVNDPAVRSSAFNSAPIPWENHQAWFTARLADHRCGIWIASDETGRPVGQMRLEGQGDEACIDLSVAAEFRGKRYAPRLIRLAMALLLDDPRWRSIRAWVKPENTASQRAFEQAGFQRVPEESLQGKLAVGYRFGR